MLVEVPARAGGGVMTLREGLDVGDAMWLVAAAVAAVGAALVVWSMRRGRKRPGQPPVQAPVESAAPVPVKPVAAAPVRGMTPSAVAAPAIPLPALPPSVPPATPKPPAPRVVAAPGTTVPQARVAPRVVDLPRVPVLPKVSRFELRDAATPVLVLERADATAWGDGAALACTPVQREHLSGLLARASQLDGASPDGAAQLYAVRLRAGAALALARSESAADGAATLESVPPLALDPGEAANFAAAALALQAARAHLPGLHAQVAETKAVAAALHPKLMAQTEGRLKSLVQDLARYLREAEENYAGAVRKPVFIARVEAACDQAAALCQGAQAAAGAARAQLEPLAQAPRFGEVQLERSLAALRDLQGQRRVQDAAVRILSGWEQLRLVLGEGAPAAAAILGEADRALAAGVEADRQIAGVITARVEAAKAPDYVGKAEFIANRTAALDVLAALEPSALAAARESLARAAAALAAGFAGHAAQALLLRVDGAARVVEVREPAGVSSPVAG